MRKSVYYRSIILWVCIVLFCCTVGYAQETKDDFVPGSSPAVASGPSGDVHAKLRNDLKKQCLAATLTAINMEISRYNNWIEYRKTHGEADNLPFFEDRLAELQADLAKYSAMDAGDYILPKKITAVAWVEGQAGAGSILYVEDMSRSGPWYHMAGIAGGDYAALQPQMKHSLTFYPVYRRDYSGMDSAYVFVAGGGDDESAGVPTEQGKRFTGEVFRMTPFSMPVAEKVKCENYRIYLLKDEMPGVQGKLVLDSKTSEFDFTLPEVVVEQYSYLEFVYAGCSKIIKLSEIKDGPLEIVLQPQVVIKKPAIYLYPPERTQITVTHTFKGQILNTYPAYDGHWTVVADPDGNLLNVRDQRFYKYLFWDGAYTFSAEHYKFSDGFYVKRQDYVSFLQTKLAAIGLNENEINDFIVYWLPAMSRYKNSFVHFRINDNIDETSVLVADPAPDTTIRVFMEFSGANEFSSAPRLPEQQLPSFVRKGFTLVEWGGAEIGSSRLE